MAKLVAVCRDDEFQFERRQIPLMIEETLTMVMEIPETVISAECVTSVDVSQFVKKYSCLTHAEMTSALMVRQKDLFSLLAISVPCVGCRRSVERLYKQLWQSGQPALEPLTICASGVLTLSDSFLVDAKLIYALFYIHGTHLNDVVVTIPKSKRNKRCILHSLETHKAARATGWVDVWDLLSQDCRDEVVLIDSDSLLDTLENYLRKHRFCSECKSKVLKAYSILAGDTDGDSEKGYCATLYEGLKSCPKERHIHVVCDTDYIANLIGRAEPELAGGRRERHARTIDIAQEEVLTCLGIHLWERLHRLWQKLRAEEQTWQILFYLGVEALRKRFETAVEEKQGISQLELVVEEISEAEKAKEQRRENKRLKRKKRKENKAKLNGEANKAELPAEEEKPPVKCDKEEKETPSEGVAVTALEIDKEYDDCSSEKSSTDSQASPGKSDNRSATPPTPSKLSPCSSLSDSTFPSLLKPVEDVALKVEEKPAPCQSKNENKKCNTTNSCSEANKPQSCPKAPSTPKKHKCQDEDTTCSEKEVNSPPWLEANPRKGDSCRNGSSSKENKRNNSGKDCECDSTLSNGKSNYKKNGFLNHHENSRGGGVYFKRNGYNDCRSSPSVGPRFSRYENQARWKDSGECNGDDVASTCGRGRGNVKRGKPANKFKDSPSLLTNSHWGSVVENKNTTNQSHLKSNHYHHHHTPPASTTTTPKNGGIDHNVVGKEKQSDDSCPPEVEDENELRLLKMMGWTSKAEDTICLSEQEIQEYKASKSDVQSRRQELRNKLRDQFQKLCINHVSQGCNVCNVCT